MANELIPPWLQEHCSRLLSNDKTLTNLNLNIRQLNIECMVALEAAMRQTSHLYTLNLTTSLTTDPLALEVIAQVICHHVSLKVLHLSYNRLLNVTCIGQALMAKNSTLTHLYLDYNLIDRQSCLALADGLCHNTTLEVLQLGSNNIGDEGCIALAKAVACNKTLRILGLARNGITNKGAAAMEEAMQSNFTIEYINCDKNWFPSVQQTRLELMCRANKAGRSFLTSPSLENTACSPIILERVAGDLDLLAFFLKAKPELCRTIKCKRRRLG
jgi:Leucine-rich repeat (LRR) protein